MERKNKKKKKKWKYSYCQRSCGDVKRDGAGETVFGRPSDIRRTPFVVRKRRVRVPNNNRNDTDRNDDDDGLRRTRKIRWIGRRRTELVTGNRKGSVRSIFRKRRFLSRCDGNEKKRIPSMSAGDGTRSGEKNSREWNDSGKNRPRFRNGIESVFQIETFTRSKLDITEVRIRVRVVRYAYESVWTNDRKHKRTIFRNLKTNAFVISSTFYTYGPFRSQTTKRGSGRRRSERVHAVQRIVGRVLRAEVCGESTGAGSRERKSGRDVVSRRSERRTSASKPIELFLRALCCYD